MSQLRNAAGSKILVWLLTVIMILGAICTILPTETYAETLSPVPTETYTGYGPRLKTDSGQYLKMSTSGTYRFEMGSGANKETAYCLDHGLLNGPVQYVDISTTPANISSSQVKILKKIASFGYSSARGTFCGKAVTNKTERECAFMATQILVWEFMGGMRSDFSNNGTMVSSLQAIGKTGVAEYYTKLLKYLTESEKATAFLPNGFYSTVDQALAQPMANVDLRSLISSGKSEMTVTADLGEYGYALEKIRIFDDASADDSVANSLYEFASANWDAESGYFQADFKEDANGGNQHIKGFGAGSANYYKQLYIGVKNIETIPDGHIMVLRIFRPAELDPSGDGTLNYFEASPKGKFQRRVYCNITKHFTVAYAAIKFTSSAQTEIKKVWSDNNNADGTRPSSIQVQLYKNGTLDRTVTIGYDSKGNVLAGTTIVDANTWSYDIKTIPGYDANATYTAKEVDNGLSALGYTVPTGNSLLITNVKGNKSVNFQDQDPKFTFPSFNIEGEKQDKDGGFDDNVNTARGNGTLAAGFRITVDNNKGKTINETVYAPHDGKYAECDDITPWKDTSDGAQTSQKTVTLCDGTTVNTELEYTFKMDVDVEEIVPEGYLSEPDSGTGTGSRSYTVTYVAKATRTVEDVHDPVTGEHTGVNMSDWQYSYKSTSSDTGTDTKTGTAHDNLNIANPLFKNKVKTGTAQLVKTYDEDLDQWTNQGGVKKQMNGTWWTLEVLDKDVQGNPYDDGGDENVDGGGSEGHEYVMVQLVKKGEAGYSPYGNTYRVVTSTAGNAAHASPVITADGGTNHDGSTANTNNVLITGGETDSTGKEKGQIFILDLPYGCYKFTEVRCTENEGYVLETYTFKVDDEGDSPSQEVNDEVIKNQIVITKRDSETGKVIPYAGAAFRIRYMGYYHTNEKTGQVEFMTNAHSGTYINNGRDVEDGYEFVFVTDATGKIKIPYDLEYGVWQLEEITAPYGYYIGDYSGDGKAKNTEGTKGYYDTVAIFDKNGNKVDYLNDEDVLYNYWKFEVSDQTKTDDDGDGIYTLNVVINNQNPTNNSTKGKIEIKKIGEKLVGFKVSDSEYGEVKTPVYEMTSIPGAKFEIVAAEDVKFNDGYEAPELYDAKGNKVKLDLEKYTHLLWPEAESIRKVTLTDGTEAYIVETLYSNSSGNTTPIDTANKDNFGTGNDTNDGGATTNVVSANLLTSLKKGVGYTLSYDVKQTDPDTGVELTSTYDIEIGLEYAAGGWNYSYFDITRKTKASDYNDEIPSSLPFVTQDGTVIDMGELEVGTKVLSDGSTIEVKEKTDIYENEDDVSVERVYVKNYEKITPILATRPAHNYLSTSTALTLTIPNGYSTNPADSSVDNVSTYGGYTYTNGTNYIHAILNAEGQQAWITSDSADQEMEDYYSNQPDVTEQEAAGWTIGVETVTIDKVEDPATEFTGELFVLTKGTEKQVYLQEVGKTDTAWINTKNLVSYGTFGQLHTSYDVPLEDGYTISTNNYDFGYVARNANADAMMLVKVLDTGELKWVHCSPKLETYLSRTEHMTFDLNESNASLDGFDLTWEGFEFKNDADHTGQYAIASMTNPSENDAEFRDGIGCDVTESADGKTITVKVVQPEKKAHYELADGSTVGITYLGGYTKTIIEVPADIQLPIIKQLGKVIEYAETLTPSVTYQKTDLGDGNYIDAVYDQANLKYTITIVSNATDKDKALILDYYTGQTGYSLVSYDPEEDAYRGQLVIEGLSKTLVYKNGAVIETVTTASNGVGYSGELPLGTYYVRELDAGNGYVINTDSFEVELDYAGQYVPLVWSAATIENEALNVNIDIAKSFQEAYGSDNYIYKAGAVFGVYNKEDITAAATASSADVIDVDTAEAESLLDVITIGDDGYANSTIKLPFMNDYFIKELDTLDGYTLSDVEYLFKVDEQTIADNLKFEMNHCGISGEINQTDLFETTITIDTLYQVPSKTLTVNGEEIISDTAKDETLAGAAFVTNEIFGDKAKTTVRATSTAPTVITFENGATLTVNVYSDGYTAEFTDPTEAGCAITTDRGSVNTTTITEETLTTGEKKFTYNPKVAYTGYSVDVTHSYVIPETVMNTEDDVRINFLFDKASGHRKAVLSYPSKIDLPKISASETWLSKDLDAKTVTVDIDELLLTGHSDYEYKVITKLVEGTFAANDISYVVNSANALTSSKVITDSSALAKFDGKKATVTVDSSELSAINTKIAEMYAAGDTLAITSIPLTFKAADANGHEMTVGVTVELRGKDAVSTLGTDISNIGDTDFPTYGESIYFTIAPKQFSVKTAGNACSDANGTNRDSFTVTKDTDNTTVSHENNVFAVTSENGTSSMQAVLNHDSTYAQIYMTTGSVSSAYDGTSAITFVDGYILNAGNNLTLAATDGTVYTAQLDNNGVLKLHAEDVIDGSLATGTNAPSATLNGDVVYTSTKASANPKAKFEETITYARSSNAVSAISVKVNSVSENHMTTNQEQGTSDGRTTDVKNEIISVDFTKEDLLGKALSGAVIGVYDSTGKEVWRGTTGNDGIATWKSATAGEYTFREITAPTGYEKDTNVYDLTVYANGTVNGNTTIFNHKKPVEPTPDKPDKPDKKESKNDIYITKTDATDGKVVAGAQIKVWNSETGKVIFEGTTDRKGRIEFKKPAAGTYYFKETVAPNGYLINEETFKFTIDKAGVIHGTLGIKDYPENDTPTIENDKLVISKTDATDAAPVPGAQITIYNEDGSVFYSGTTDSNGKITFDKVTGKYTFKETYAPEGYDLNTTIFNFEVLADGSVKGKTGIKDVRTGTVVLSKIDIVDGHEIPGAEIVVLDSNGNEVFRQVSDEYGKVYFYPLNPGTYEFYETSAPNGYYLNVEHFKFTVDKDGKITSGVTYLENVPEGTVVIKKTDVSDGKELPDCEITIWDESGNVVFKDTTDERGRVYFATPGAGTYYFKETHAPNGYVINEETFSFSIDENFVITGATNIQDAKVVKVVKTGIENPSDILLFITLAFLAIACVTGGIAWRVRRKEN